MSCASSDTLVPSADSHEVSTAEIQRIKDIVRDVRSWMSNDKGAQTFTFLDFSKAGRDLLEIRLIEDGLRLQLDWSSASKRVDLRTHHDLYGVHNDWLCRSIPVFQYKVAKHEEWLGFAPILCLGGRVGCELSFPDAHNTEILQPDQSILLMKPVNKTQGEGEKRGGEEEDGEDEEDVDLEEYEDEDDVESYNLKRVYVQYLPTVVLQVCFSQDLDKVLAKAWKYLHASGGQIRAVIIYKMSYPVGLDRDFRSEIAVWVRKEGVLVPRGCEGPPVVPTPQQADNNDHKASGRDTATAITATAITATATDGGKTPAQSWRDGVYVLPGQEHAIQCRSGPIVLIDEAQPEPCNPLTKGRQIPMLTLSVLDFAPVRRTANHSPNTPDPKNLHFKVSLASLHKMTLSSLAIIRTLLRRSPYGGRPPVVAQDSCP